MAGDGRGVRRRWPRDGGGRGGEMRRRRKLTGGVPPGWGKITLHYSSTDVCEACWEQINDSALRSFRAVRELAS
jgi:hypothetical protein